MSKKLPERPNLLSLKKQAKAILRRVRSGDATTINQIKNLIHRYREETDVGRFISLFALHDAQFLVAQEYGFKSWRELRQAISPVTDEDISIVEAEEDPEVQLDPGLVSAIRVVAGELQRHDWPLADCLSHVYEKLHTVVPFQRMGLAMISEEGSHVHVHWTRSELPIRLGLGYQAALTGSSLEMVMGSGQPRIIDDLSAYLRAHRRSASTALLVAEGFRSSVTCPLFIGGEPCAFLFFTSIHTHSFVNAHAMLMQSELGAQLSFVMERWRNRGALLTDYFQPKSKQRDLRIEMRGAQRAQREMLNIKDSAIPGLEVAFTYEPLGFVGGDLIDLVKLPDQSAFIFVGDAMGHGIEAGLVISSVQGALRTVLNDNRTPDSVLRQLNRSLVQMVQSYFATAACALINLSDGWVEVSLAGHYPPMIVRANRQEIVEPGLDFVGLPLGVQKDEVYASGRFPFEPGDTIILFTDGIVEAINASMEPYGREGIRNIIKQDFNRSAGDLVQAIRADFKRFNVGRRIADDVTIVAIRLETPDKDA